MGLIERFNNSFRKHLIVRGLIIFDSHHVAARLRYSRAAAGGCRHACAAAGRAAAAAGQTQHNACRQKSSNPFSNLLFHLFFSFCFVSLRNTLNSGILCEKLKHQSVTAFQHGNDLPLP